MGILIRLFSILAGAALAFVGYAILVVEGLPQPYAGMQVEREVLGGLVLLAGLSCVWSGIKPKPRRRAANRPSYAMPAPAPSSGEEPPAEDPEPARANFASGALALAPLVSEPPKPDAPPSARPSAGFAEHLAQGDRLVAEGRLEEALEPYSEALAQARQAHKADPGNPTARDLAKALKANADVYDDQGRMDAALDHYDEALGLRRALAGHGAQADRRDLSVLLERLGDCREARGHRSRALDLYRESFGIAEGLVRDDPGNSLYAEDLAVTRRRIDELETAGALV